jgi:hypothetical protein
LVGITIIELIVSEISMYKVQIAYNKILYSENKLARIICWDGGP